MFLPGLIEAWVEPRRRAPGHRHPWNGVLPRAGRRSGRRQPDTAEPSLRH
jgi:hypothetical protein